MATSLIPLKQQKKVVTYYVDTGTVYTAKVKKGADCLSDLSFTPSLSGYTFIGWRQDTTASSTVISSLTVGSDAISVYAVFRKTITLTYYNGSSTKNTTTGYQYYNNGNVKNPTFTLTAASVSGFAFDGWCTSSSATADVVYSSISSREFSADTTVYAKYSQTITLTYYSTSSTASTATGTRYFNSGNYLNPTFTISDPSVSSWTFLGWCTSSSATAVATYSSISATEFTADTTLYAKYSQTITLSYNGNSATSGSVSSQSGTRYWNTSGDYNNPSFTIKSNGFTRTNYVFLNWALGSASGTQYAAGASITLSESKTLYAVWDVICRIVLSIAGTTGADLYFYTNIYNNATGATLASYTHQWGSVYGSWIEYGGAIRVRWYTTTSDPWMYATWVALTNLYSSSALSTVSLASGSSVNKNIPNVESTTTVATYYATYSNLSL